MSIRDSGSLFGGHLVELNASRSVMAMNE